MRRTERQITGDEARSILKRGEFGVLSTVSPGGSPYGVPLSYCLMGGALYVHCAPEGTKLANLEHDPRVSFCVVGATEVMPSKFGTRYESCIVEGVASEVFEGEKQLALEGLVAKYSQGYEAEGRAYIDGLRERVRVFKISLVSMTGKARRS
jgi:uncharacterized protein